jgi:DNA-binding transcriptional ArsR family regulator
VDRRPQQVAIDSVETLKVFGDPLRLRLLILLDRPHTAKEAAAELGVPVTRLYYHLRLLEDRGLVRVVQRRKVSGIEQRTYQSVARGWTIAPEVAAGSLESAGVLAALLNVVHAELAFALHENPDTPIGDGKSPLPLLGLNRLALSPHQVEELTGRLRQLLEEYACDEPVAPAGTRLHHVFVAGYPLPEPGSHGATRI